MVFKLIVVIGLSLGISATCSVLEAVLLRISHAFIGVLNQRGDRAGAILAGMRRKIDEPIAAILTLNTIAHTVGAAVGGAIALQLFGQKWIALFSALLTLAILVFSEIIPKTFGATYWQGLARPTAYTLRFMVLVMKPILAPLAVVNRWLAPKSTTPTVSRAELEVLAQIGLQEGTLDEDEWQVVHNIMRLDEVTVEEVMTPRTAMVAIPVEANIKEAMNAVVDEGHSRLPVYDGTKDHIVGILLARDLWRADRDGDTEIRPILRTPHFVPGSKSVEQMIAEMRRDRYNMAIVLDEFGGTAGLATLEDLIEEIVGEIQDEHESELPPIEESASGEVLVGGRVPVRELNERYELGLPEDVATTVGGLVLAELDRIGRPGDEVEIDGSRFRVVDVEGHRIRRVALLPGDIRRPPNETAEGDEKDPLTDA